MKLASADLAQQLPEYTQPTLPDSEQHVFHGAV